MPLIYESLRNIVKISMAYNSRSEFRLLAAPSGSYNAPVANMNGNLSNGVPDVVVDAYISGSAARIDAALRTHHALPLSTGSSDALELIKRKEMYMVAEGLLCWLKLPPEKHGVVKEEYDEITKKDGWLDRVRDGSEILDTPTNTIDAKTSLKGEARVGRFPSDFRYFVVINGIKSEAV